MGRARKLFAAALLLITGSAAAEEVITYHGCTDASGKAVPSQEDANLPVVVDSRIEAGRPVIRYNPAVLPSLSPNARLFFYAHECARNNLGLPVDAGRSLQAARRADCWGLAAMLRSGLVQGLPEVKALQGELAFSAEQWRLLPGPPRSFDLAACYEAELDRPRLDAPSPNQPDWNSCVRQCADSLHACNRSSGPGTPSCRERYERCSSMCEFRFPS